MYLAIYVSTVLGIFSPVKMKAKRCRLPGFQLLLSIERFARALF